MQVPYIQTPVAGHRIDELRKQQGYTVKDIQEVMGFEQPQAVYKWINGQSLPSTDNLLILSYLFGVSINYILVGDEDFSFSMANFLHFLIFLIFLAE